MERKREKYSIEEKSRLADLADKYKREYLEEAEEKKNDPKQWDKRRKKSIKNFLTFSTPYYYSSPFYY